MKKTLLSVVAAGLVATAVSPVALANDRNDAKELGKEINTGDWSEKEKQEAADYLRSLREPRLNADGTLSVAYVDANGNLQRTNILNQAGKHLLPNGKFLVLKAPFKAEKTPAKPGVKALPKTSAVK